MKGIIPPGISNDNAGSSDSVKFFEYDKKMNSVKSPLQELIERVVVEKADLSKAETVFAFDNIFHGNESDITIGSVSNCFGHEGRIRRRDFGGL